MRGQIKSHLSQSSATAQGQQKLTPRYTYTLFLIPRVSTLVSRILEEEGVLGELTISSYELQFIPLDEDVISLEREGVWREIWMDGDETAVYDAAQALVTLQKVYGKFPRVLGKGDKAAVGRFHILCFRYLMQYGLAFDPTPANSLTDASK